MLKKLRTKFVCIMMVVITIMLSAILGLVIYFAGRGLEDKSIQLLERVTDGPHRPGNVKDDPRGAPKEDPKGEPKDEPKGVPEIERLPVIIADISSRGEILSAKGGIVGLFEETTITEIVNAAIKEDEKIGVLEEYDLRYSKTKTREGECIVFADISDEKAAIDSLFKICILIGSISFAVFFILSCLLAKWAVKPVEHAWEQQRQFVADASHELKTPLSVITTNAELLRYSSYDEGAKQQFSESILIMARQMRKLVEGLLELARADNGGMKNGFSELDFSQLVSESLLPFEPLFFEKNLELEASIKPEIKITGSSIHIKQVLDVFLDNAMKYSTPAGRVSVCVKRQGSGCLLSVSSPGDAIMPADLKNIFKRFYRIEKARSRDGSYGLGLSIAQSIVLEHGGKIWAESKDGTNTFYVQLPAI